MNAVEKAIEARDEYLKAHPHLQEKQDEIDEILSKTSVNDRMETLNLLMSTSLIELQTNLLHLVNILNETQKG